MSTLCQYIFIIFHNNIFDMHCKPQSSKCFYFFVSMNLSLTLYYIKFWTALNVFPSTPYVCCVLSHDVPDSILRQLYNIPFPNPYGKVKFTMVRSNPVDHNQLLIKASVTADLIASHRIRISTPHPTS